MNKNLLTKAKKTFNTRGALLIGAAVGSNFLNFVFNAFLGRSASLEEFALISLIVSILALIDIPLGALSRTVTYRSAYLFGKHNRPPKKFWLSVRKRAFLASFGMAFAWVLVTPFASSYFRLESSLPLIFFTPVLFLMVLSAVDSGYLGGNMKWDLIASILVVEAIIKLGTAALLIGVGFSDFAYLSIILSVCVSSILYILAARKLNKGIHIKKQDVTKFPRRFFFSSAAAKISTIIYLSIDVILAKHYLAPEQAGQYALMSLSGKMVFFAGSLFSQFILPVVSHSQGAGNKSRNIFLKLLTASGIASIFAFVVIGAFGHITMPILFGERANAITSYIMAYSLSMVLFTASTNITTFHLLKGRHSASFVACLVSLIQILGIVFFHSSIREISSVMVFSGFLSLALMSLYHFIEPWISILTTNTVDALEPFFPNKKQAKVKGLQILIFNWRDTKHVWSGGAEVYVHQ